MTKNSVLALATVLVVGSVMASRVEAAPVFGLLFLNNNLHYVHHENPRVSWYKLPALYRANRAAFLAANGSYSFKGYGEMIRKYLFRAKSPVPHPYLRRG